jgi:hypothetical protein
MFKLRFLFQFTAMLLLAILPAWLQADTLAQRVPDDAIMYMSWSGTAQLEAVYDKSTFKKVLVAAGVDKIMADELPKLFDKLPGDDNAKAAEALKLLEPMRKYPMAVYFAGAKNYKADTPAAGGLKLAVLMDAGADAAKVAEAVTKLIKDMPAEDQAKAQLTTKVENNLVIMTLGGYELPKPTKTLAELKSYVAMFPANKDMTNAVTAYMDVPKLITEIEQAAKADATVTEFAQWTRIKLALGLMNITQFGMIAGFEGTEWREEFVLGMGAKRNGALEFLTTKPVDQKFLASVTPKNALSITAGRLDVPKVIKYVRDMVNTTEPEKTADFDDAFKQGSEAVGLDIQKDILEPLGDEWLVVRLPAIMINIPGMGGPGGGGMATPLQNYVVANRVKDAAKVQKALDTLQALLVANMPARGGMGFSEEKIGETTLQVLSLGNEIPVKINPAWGIHKGTLMIAMDVQSIRDMIAQGDAKTSLLDEKQYQTAMNLPGAKTATSLAYADMKQVAGETFGYVKMWGGMMLMQGGDNIPAWVSTVLENLDLVADALTPCSTVTYVDEVGFHMVTRSPMPVAPLLAGQPSGMVMAVGAGIALPAIGSAPVQANRTATLSNAVSITRSVIVYATDKDDKYPAHLAELIATQNLEPSNLISKRTGTKPLVLTDADKTAAEKDWKTIKEKVDNACDFIYAGAGMKNTGDAELILLLENPNGAKEGVVVGYQDGHAEFVKFVDLQAQVDKLNAARKELKLEPITVLIPKQGKGTVGAP